MSLSYKCKINASDDLIHSKYGDSYELITARASSDTEGSDLILFDRKLKDFTAEYKNRGRITDENLDYLFESIVTSEFKFSYCLFGDDIPYISKSSATSLCDMFFESISVFPFDPSVYIHVDTFCGNDEFLHRLVRKCYFGLLYEHYVVATTQLFGSSSLSSTNVDELASLGDFSQVSRMQTPNDEIGDWNIERISKIKANEILTIKKHILSSIQKLVGIRKWLFSGVPLIANFMLYELTKQMEYPEIYTHEVVCSIINCVNLHTTWTRGYSSSIGSGGPNKKCENGPRGKSVYLRRLVRWCLSNEVSGDSVVESGARSAAANDYIMHTRISIVKDALPSIWEILRREEATDKLIDSTEKLISLARFLQLLSHLRFTSCFSLLNSDPFLVRKSRRLCSSLYNFSSRLFRNPHYWDKEMAMEPLEKDSLRRFISRFAKMALREFGGTSPKTVIQKKCKLTSSEMYSIRKKSLGIFSEENAVGFWLIITLLQYLQSIAPYMHRVGDPSPRNERQFAEYFSVLLNTEDGILVEISDILQAGERALNSPTSAQSYPSGVAWDPIHSEIEIELLFTHISMYKCKEMLELQNKITLMYHFHYFLGGFLDKVEKFNSLLKVSGGNLSYVIMNFMNGKNGTPSVAIQVELFRKNLRSILLLARILICFTEIGDVDFAEAFNRTGALEIIIDTLEEISYAGMSNHVSTEDFGIYKDGSIGALLGELGNLAEESAMGIPKLAMPNALVEGSDSSSSSSSSTPESSTEREGVVDGDSEKIEDSHQFIHAAASMKRLTTSVRSMLIALVLSVLFGGDELVSFSQMDLIELNGNLRSVFHMLFVYLVNQEDVRQDLQKIQEATGSKHLQRILKLCVVTPLASHVSFQQIKSQSRLAQRRHSRIMSPLPEPHHVGYGRFGRVIECFQCGLGGSGDAREAVAVKLVPIQSELDGVGVAYQSIIHDTYNEITIMEQNKGDARICDLIDYGFEGSDMYIIMRKYKSNLLQWRKEYEVFCEERKMKPNIHFLLNVYLDLLKTCLFLVEKNIVHFDLKCENVLLDPLPYCSSFDDLFYPPDLKPMFSLVLADFGESLRGDSSVCTLRTRGTECNMSPEMFDLSINAEARKNRKQKLKRVEEITSGKHEVSHKSDIWSLGCLFFELISGEKLFSGSEFSSCFQNIEDSMFVSQNEENRMRNKDILVKFVKKIMHKDPRRRPSLREIIREFNQVRAKVR